MPFRWAISKNAKIRKIWGKINTHIKYKTINSTVLVCLVLGWTLPGSPFLGWEVLRTAAVMRHMGPAVPTSASSCLQKSHECWVSACFRTPRLSLGHPGSFKSAHVLKCMRTQTRPRFNVPSEQRGVTSFSNTQSHRCTMPRPGIEPRPFPRERRSLTTRLPTHGSHRCVDSHWR